MGIGVGDRMMYRRFVTPLANGSSRREDAVVYRAGFSNETGSLALRLWDKLDYFAHIRSKHLLENEFVMR